MDRTDVARSRPRIPGPSPRDRIVERLVMEGIPREVLEESPMGLVSFLKEREAMIPMVVSLILPTEVDVSELRGSLKPSSGGHSRCSYMDDLFGESIVWLKWLMFEAKPQEYLQSMEQKSIGQRAICGAVWGQNELAYVCRTCELDTTCAICVPCFQNGNHKDHDYSIIYTAGGCCDCGDVTAWKREGFCSMHKGTEKVQPLPERLANTVRPILDRLLVLWKDKVTLTQISRSPRGSNEADVSMEMGNKLSFAVVEMLLEFCKCSESFLSYISRRMFECDGLLEVLVRAERFLEKNVSKKLHELLMRLLGDPVFKYEFAKVFTRYYAVITSELIKECSHNMLEKYSMLPFFSVQIFTVPSLTLRLIEEVNLLGVLLGCLRELLIICVGEDGQLQSSMWANLYGMAIRLVADMSYVLSHKEVLACITHEQPDILRDWLKLLTFLQGMNPQKRIRPTPMDEGYDYLFNVNSSSFRLEHTLADINEHVVRGAFFACETKGKICTCVCCQDYEDMGGNKGHHHSKIARISRESSACSTSSRDYGLGPVSRYGPVKSDGMDHLSIPSPVIWLIFECLKAIDRWLCLARNPSMDDPNCSSFNSFRKKLFRLKRSADIKKVHKIFISRHGDQLLASSEHHERSDFMDTDIYPTYTSSIRLPDNCSMEVDTQPEAFGILNTTNWPDLVYDVSSQEISFHIPLHRLLSLVLRQAMKYCYADNENLQEASSGSSLPSSHCSNDFFRQVMRGLHPCGFSASLMEHPLRLCVFSAQVRAGMWRRNHDAAMLGSEYYRGVQWFNQGIQADLFLLQCCAALAPPELFVERIQERFGLLNYTVLNLSACNEFETTLVHEMLTLIIQIIQERRFCGLSEVDNLKRELIHELAVGDATHSHLLEALPADLSKIDQIESILDMIATYSKPSGIQQGTYSLRKAYWKELDLYHPRWNYKDLQMAEERYFRFCKVSAQNVQLPRWTNVYDPLRTISRIATSKSVLKLVRAVFFYAAFADVLPCMSRAPDGVLITALHLLSLALDICGSQTKFSNNASGIDLSYPDDQVHKEVSDNLSPLLACVTEEIDATAHGGLALFENQSMLSLLVILMRKHKEESEHNYSESSNCNILSLIRTLLKKIAGLNTQCLTVLQKLAPEVVCDMPKQTAEIASMRSSASTSDAERRRAKARDRQAAIMEKMKAEQMRFIASLKTMPESERAGTISKEEESNLDDIVPEESAVFCSLCRDLHSQSPLYFLILLQKSCLATFIENGPLSWESLGWQDKDIQASGIQHANDPIGVESSTIAHLVQNAGRGLHFDIESAEDDTSINFPKEHLSNIKNIQPNNMFSGMGPEVTITIESLEYDIYQSVLRDIHNCISISDTQDGGKRFLTKDAIVGSGIVRKAKPSYVEDVASVDEESKKIHSSNYSFQQSSRSITSSATISRFGLSNCDGIHISSCGHAVHRECYEGYLLSLKQRYTGRIGFENSHSVDPNWGELLCPVCRRFANSILPASISLSNTFSRMKTSVDVSSISADTNCSNLYIHMALSLIRNAAVMVAQNRTYEVLSGKFNETMNSGLGPALQKLCMLYYPDGHGCSSTQGKLSKSLILWDTLRYSVISAEIAARARLNTCSDGSMTCVESLKDELHSTSGHMMSVLLHAAQANRSCNGFEVLLRFSSLQLLAGSICSDLLDNGYITKGDKLRGTILSLLEYADDGEVSHDIEFWKHAADPILVQDPFSSLMWILFCLPSPFIFSRECFTALVHLFYVVCVVQAIVTCYGKQSFKISSFDGSFFKDICKSITQFELVRQYFISSYIDPLCCPNDMIRRLTFPYLRRCALLCELLNSSVLSPLYENHTWAKSYHCPEDSVLDRDNCLKVELDRIRELEDMFNICSFESVLKDEIAHALALRWCDHVNEEFRVHKYRGTLASTPAVSFKLIELPIIYQDLLQRCIKLKCSNCNNVPKEPALCLLCGKLCSPNWKSCCRSSSCLDHAMICGAGVGVFLLVRGTIILLQRSAGKAFWPSPYLDAFGEEDHGIKRGKPLYLSKERYEALAYMVASHGLDRSSEVLQQTTIILNDLD